MRSSAEKFRWILLSGGLLLACIIAAVFGMANYRAGVIWRRILARNGVNLKQETDGFTYSQSDGKRTIFTLHAARARPQGPGKWSLSNAVLVLYAKDGRTDRIYGSQFDYDQNAGLARAVGEVHMDLQAPAASGKAGHPAPPVDLSFTPGEDSAENPALIHVRTSGLVYMRKLGVAATPELAEFRYGGITCTSRGAEFDSGPNILRLLADVHMDGTLRTGPFHLLAAHADLDRTASTANLLNPVLDQKDRRARADHAILHLRPSGSVSTGDADGGVELRTGTQTILAPRLQGEFDPEDRPQHALFSGGVRFTDSDLQRPSHGQAKTLELQLTETGLLQTATADGGVDFSSQSGANAAAGRHIGSQRAVASFGRDATNARRSVMRTLHLTGAAEVTGDTPARVVGDAPGSTRVDADDLTTTFAANGRTLQPISMAGNGRTRLEQRGSEGQHQISTGDVLEVRFGQRSPELKGRKAGAVVVQAATQSGHVVLRSWGSKKTLSSAGRSPVPLTGEPEGGTLTVGHAQQAVFEAGTDTLTLTGEHGGRADVYDGETQIASPTIVLHQSTGDGEAIGEVVATTGGEQDAPATHVLAARAHLLHTSGISEFFGTDSQPAQLWQGGSQVQAASLLLDGKHHGLSARPEGKGGRVHAVFANGKATSEPAGAHGERSHPGHSGANETGQPMGGAFPVASRDSVEVQAATMDYSDTNREATFGGGVRLRGSEGDITGEHGAAFLSPSAEPGGKPPAARPGPGASFGGQLQRFVVLGDVRMLQPGRTGAGEQLTYTTSSDNFVLTGSGANLPRIHDAKQGLVTGPTLVYGAADSSIVVAGLPATTVGAATKSSKPIRIHTETDLKQP